MRPEEFKHFFSNFLSFLDNTNPNVETRALYISVARGLNVPVRCFYFEGGEELAKHMNTYREIVTKGQHKRVPTMGYNMFKSKFQMPTMNEGFSAIKHINFVPDFASEADKLLFSQFLT